MEPECPICLSPIDTNKLFITKCCKKQFHTACFDECMKYKQECPLCRTCSDNIIIMIQEPEYVPDSIVIRYNIVIYKFLCLLFIIITIRYLVWNGYTF